MPFLGNFLAAALGLASGGVANALADDLPLRQRPRQPHCPHCGHERPPQFSLGISALIFGRWRCEACSQPLPWRHPLLEIALALAFVYLWNRYGPSVDGLFIAAYVWLAALITVIDLEHRLVLHIVMGPALLLALAEAVLTPRLPFLSAVSGGAIGFGVVLGIYLFGWLFGLLMARLRGQPIDEVPFGFGDVTLAIFAGLVVGDGPGGIGLVLTIMIVIGGVGALAYYVYRRFIRRDYSLFTAIPYGPNVVVGMLVVLLWHQEIGDYLRQIFLGSAG